jgi:hypothetical protein
MDEQRTHNRSPYSCRVSCEVMGEHPHSPEKVATQGEMVDLSNGGMRIRNVKLKVGNLIQVRIPASEHSVYVPVLAEVRWVRQREPGIYDAGLKFLI